DIQTDYGKAFINNASLRDRMILIMGAVALLMNRWFDADDYDDAIPGAKGRTVEELAQYRAVLRLYPAKRIGGVEIKNEQYLGMTLEEKHDVVSASLRHWIMKALRSVEEDGMPADLPEGVEKSPPLIVDCWLIQRQGYWSAEFLNDSTSSLLLMQYFG
ncbi:MAG: hypothetical protein Q9184_008098, partial [Pyrenodesmia sp. 2 TL-2023]